MGGGGGLVEGERERKNKTVSHGQSLPGLTDGSLHKLTRSTAKVGRSSTLTFTPNMEGLYVACSVSVFLLFFGPP